MRAVALFVCFFFALAACTDVDVSFRGQVINVAVVPKTAAHPYFGQGFTFGYTINGVEGATLIVSSGLTYTFNFTAVTCNHPWYITEDPSGQSVNQITDGVVTTDYTSLCQSAQMTWTPNASFVGFNLFYQCRTHSKMGYKIVVKPPSLCNKYSTALGLTNLQLITFVVNETFNTLLAPNHPLRGFFDGRIPSGSTDFTSNPTAAANLFNKLVQFFGAALGCGDPTFPPYVPTSSLQAIHSAMPIATFEFNTFNNVILGILTAAHVAPEDVAAVRAVLQSTKPAICNQGDCRAGICDRYSDALNITNVQLMTTLVTNTFVALINSPLRSYFNASVRGTTKNFITDLTRQGQLVNGLVSFFGQAAVLSCTDVGFPAYTGADMTATHIAFPIGPGEFDLFNTLLLGVARSAGVVQSDLTAIGAVLESTRPAVCNQCGAPSTSTGSQPNNGPPPFVLYVVPKVNHPWTDGFPSGFKIDGTEGGAVNLTVGVQYGFQNMGGCAHPLFISTSDQGAGLSPVTTGVIFPQGNQFGACGGQVLFFTPDASMQNTRLFYQCQNHMRMGGPINIGNPGNPSGTSAAVTLTGSATTSGEQSYAAVVVPSIVLALLLVFISMF